MNDANSISADSSLIPRLSYSKWCLISTCVTVNGRPEHASLLTLVHSSLKFSTHSHTFLWCIKLSPHWSIIPP